MRDDGKDITTAALRHARARGGVAVHNWEPPGWWECDVCHLSDVGLWSEFEVKASYADYLRDAEKTVFSPDVGAYVNKHERTAKGQGPQRFWFVVRKALASRIRVPAWAGLIVAHRVELSRRWVIREIIKHAPVLHKRGAPQLWTELAYREAYRRAVQWELAYASMPTMADWV